MAIAIALIGFVDPYFSFQKQILFTIISKLSKNEQKNQCGKVKEIHDFCPRHETSNPAIMRLQGA